MYVNVSESYYFLNKGPHMRASDILPLNDNFNSLTVRLKAMTGVFMEIRDKVIRQ